MTKMDKYERRLASYAIRNSKVLNKLFDELQNKLIQLGLKADNLHPDDLFTFARKAPKNVQKEVDKLLSDFHDKVTETISEGIDWAYGTSIAKNNALFGEMFSKGYNLSFNRRNTAKNAYINDRLRLTNGLTLSDRVWNYTNQQKAEFEGAMTVALEEGTDNETLGRNIRKYLKDPDMCYKRYHLKKVLKNGDKKDVVKWYKRVIGDDGKVHFVQADLEHVGRGVYRSARKNALRASRTEINMAYRSADNEAYKSTPFVLGIKVQLSNNHPEGDICDELAGRYPRDFVFIGWHPLCRCHAVPILPSVDDMAKYINAGSPAGYFDKRYVDDVPDAFKGWVKDNKEKIESDKWKNPYFVDANKGVVDRVLGEKAVKEASGAPVPKPRILASAKARHENRTPDQIRDVENKWRSRSANNIGEQCREISKRLGELEVKYGERFKFGDYHVVFNSLNRAKSNIYKTYDYWTKDYSINPPKPVFIRRDFGDKNVVAQIFTDSREALRDARRQIDAIEGRYLKRIKRRSLEDEVNTMLAWDKRRYERDKAIFIKHPSSEFVKSFTDGGEYKQSYENVPFKVTNDSELRDFKGRRYFFDCFLGKAERQHLNLYRRYEGKRLMPLTEPSKVETISDLTQRLGKETPKTLANMQNAIDRNVQEKSAEGWSESEIKKAQSKMKELLDNGDYGMMISPEALTNVIEEGRFKNTFEVGNRPSDKYQANRKALERLWGGKSKAPEEYEKYGMLMDKNMLVQDEAGIGKGYGHLMVRFKKNKVVATCTLGDSYQMNTVASKSAITGHEKVVKPVPVVPSLTSDPQVSSLKNKAILNYNEDPRLTTIASEKLADNSASSHYIELQYHGNLTKDCIESVYIPFDDYKVMSKGTLDKIKSIGCPVYTSSIGGLVRL